MHAISKFLRRLKMKGSVIETPLNLQSRERREFSLFGRGNNERTL